MQLLMLIYFFLVSRCRSVVLSDFLFCYIFTLCQQKIYHHLRRARTLQRPQPRTHTVKCEHTHTHTYEYTTHPNTHMHTTHTHAHRHRRTCVHVVVLRCIARKHTNNNLYTPASSHAAAAAHCSALLFSLRSLLALGSLIQAAAPGTRTLCRDPPSQPTNQPTNPLAN